MLVSEVPAFREYWYPIAYSHEVGAGPRPFRVLGDDYVAWRPRDGGAVQAAVDECPHRSARLSQGWVEDGCLVCPYHGWRFDHGGACVHVPSNGDDVPVPPRAHVQSILADERYGLVWVCVGIPREPIPVLAELDAGYTLIHEMMETWAASAPRIVDNALDVSHVAWVHRASVGSSAAPRLGEFQVERRGRAPGLLRHHHHPPGRPAEAQHRHRPRHHAPHHPRRAGAAPRVPWPAALRGERPRARPLQDVHAGRRHAHAVLPVRRTQRPPPTPRPGPASPPSIARCRRRTVRCSRGSAPSSRSTSPPRCTSGPTA